MPHIDKTKPVRSFNCIIVFAHLPDDVTGRDKLGLPLHKYLKDFDIGIGGSWLPEGISSY